MNADFRRHLLATFATGTPEELSVLLGLIYLLSTHPQNREAGPDFSDQTGFASKHATNSMSVR